MIKYVVEGKFDQFIRAILEHQKQDKNAALSRQTISLIHDEAKIQMEQLIGNLLNAAFIADETIWLQTLQISESDVCD